jgi:signal transduction histidine kinase
MSAERRTLHRWLRRLDTQQEADNPSAQARGPRSGFAFLRRRMLLSRNDRVVATARTVIAAAALLALQLDPPRSVFHVNVMSWIAVGYLGYAVAVMALVRVTRTTILPFGIAAHVIDVITFSVLMNLTDASTSPFFVLLSFSLLSATFRWGWRGALWTTLSLVALYAASSFASWYFSPDAEFALRRFILRSAHLLTMGAMLVLFSLHQRRFGDEMIRLATWPASTPSTDQPLSGALEYAATVFGARRAILVRSDTLEPWVEVAVWSAGRVVTTQLPPGTVDPPVPGFLAGTSFLASGDLALVHRGAGRLEVWRGSEPAINESLRRRCAVDSALCFPVRTEEMDGWLLIPERDDATAEDFVAGGVAAARIALAFQRAAARDALRDATAAEHRLRLSRDLHDGVLQALTGGALKLQAALREHAVPPGLQARIGEVASLLEAEQRELRGFVTRLRPGSASVASEATVELAGYLEQLAGALRLQWGLEVVPRVDPAGAVVSGRLAHQLRHILRESAANAAKHGNARRLTIATRVGEGALRLEVIDDGSGLHEHGVFDAGELRRRGIGPRSLRERVAALGGSFTLTSDLAGTRLVMCIPLQAKDGGG